ncbi:replication initiator protein A [uncultured Sphingomonas sp.]|uniref:replication initiator protein A n=1 Tax=uncultured Sphingomonas sp. TaxID=158754 RepID=UPI0025D820D6|nr:replication initiator protein A [uncultured Sphingomonas sp.]
MSKVPALPRQISLFDMDSPLHGKVRGERSIMDFPFFVLSKKAHFEPIEYRHDGVTIDIHPGPRGIATMWDKEILLYVASLLAQDLADGGSHSGDVTFAAHDFFRITGVARPSKRDYSRFADALERLQGTQIKTNIETGSKIDRGWFSWLSEAQIEYEKKANGDEVLRYVRVRPCAWLFRAIQRDQRIYHYHHDYFRLGAIERRIYEIAHCYCGNEAIEIELEDLHRKVGSTASVRKFKQLVKEVEDENRLPEYEVVIDETTRKVRTDAIGRNRQPLRTVIRMRPRPKAITRTIDAATA